jgi:DNA-directed RNA polymerase subunit E'/Rpb7
MEGPYFNTTLYTSVALHPNQMNNDIYKNLKTNITKKLQGKCYKSYGYIQKIYSIKEKSEGILRAEDSTASAYYDVKFSCKLCKPLKGTSIICQVKIINQNLMHLLNGPINIIIFVDSELTNSDKFAYNANKNLLLEKVGDGKGIPIVNGTYMKVKVVDTKIETGTDRIIVMGQLEKIASKKEIEYSIMSIDDDEQENISYEEYISINEDDKSDGESDSNSENESEDGENNKNVKTKKQ